MADPVFRNEQWQRRFDTHIEPINRLVEELSERGWLPYVAPMYGGVNARLLSVLRDPGQKTRSEDGSGFLSMENDDPTAEAICGHFEAAGIPAIDVVPWNVYPWYINRAPSAAELDAGVEPMRRLVQLLPRLRVVMLHGGSAKNGWHKFARSFPGLLPPSLQVIQTYHTSPQAFRHPDREVRNARRKKLRNDFLAAAEALRGG